jgi:hypothetical protein
MFAWYWLADLCEDEGIPFVLGHALAMRMIHGAKTKTDRIDAAKLAGMLRGGLFPMGYVYPRAKRQTRDLLRRRSFFVRQRAQLIAHIVNTNTQFNLPPLSKKLTYAANRTAELLDRFTDPSTRLMVAADLAHERTSMRGLPARSGELDGRTGAPRRPRFDETTCEVRPLQSRCGTRPTPSRLDF